FALVAGSNAIDGVSIGGCTDLNGGVTIITDQRGIARPQGGRCDIGAYEYNGTPVPTLINPNGTITNNQPAFSWVDSAAQSYWLYVTNPNAAMISQSIPSSVCFGGTCTFTPASALPGSPYTWTVNANYGISGWSGYAPTMSFLIPPTLSAPTGLI